MIFAWKFVIPPGERRLGPDKLEYEGNIGIVFATSEAEARDRLLGFGTALQKEAFDKAIAAGHTKEDAEAAMKQIDVLWVHAATVTRLDVEAGKVALWVQIA